MGTEIITDTELLQRIRQDDPFSFELLYDRYWFPLFSFANKFLRSEEDAQDIVQIVFISMWERRASLIIHGSLRHYLFQAVRYQALKKLEAILAMPQNLERVQENLLPVFNDILERLEEQDLFKEIQQEIAGLSERTQEIFLLSRRHQLSIKEIAQRLDLSEQTVKNQLHIALKTLRRSIAFLLVFAAINP